jgi:branched-chain amino acid transport system ATP-binding protein
MLAIGRGLMSRPKFLMIDEPFLGLAPRVVTEILEIIRQINAAGVTVLFIEQNVQLALGISDTGFVLESGRMALAGPARELLESDLIRQVYLGV